MSGMALTTDGLGWGDENEVNGSSTGSYVTAEPTSASDDAGMSLIKNSVHMRMVKFLDLYIEGIIMFSGIVGNLLILAVFARRKLRHSSCIFIRALSITDFLILSICLNTHWINYNFNHTGKAVPLCKTILFLTTFFFDLEAWIIVSMTVDRFISVAYPFKAKMWCTPRSACAVLAAILCITVLKNWYVIVIGGFQYNKHLGTMICTFMYDQRKLIDRVYPWLDLVWGSFLPLAVIVALNYCIIRGLRKSAGFVTTNQNERNRRQRDRQVTVSLVTISFVFLLLTLPRKTFLVYYTYAAVPAGPARVQHAMNYLLSLTITDKLWFTNCAINIWLFSMSGSRFRREVMDVVMCRKTNRVSPSQQTNTRGDRSKDNSNVIINPPPSEAVKTIG